MRYILKVKFVGFADRLICHVREGSRYEMSEKKNSYHLGIGPKQWVNDGNVN